MGRHEVVDGFGLGVVAVQAVSFDFDGLGDARVLLLV